MWALLWREQPVHCCFPGPVSCSLDLSKWPRGPGQCSLLAGVGWWGGGGEQTLPLGGWRWHSQGLAGRAGDHQPQPSPKEPFAINLLKVEEGSSPQPHFGHPMSEACQCCLNVVTAGSLGCDLCLRHKDPSSFSSQLMLLPSFHSSDPLCQVVQPAMSSILPAQWAKGRYSSSPVLLLFLPLG